MEEVISQLASLGFEDQAINSKSLEQAVSLGSNSVTFTQVVSWLCSELQFLLQLESQVNPISGIEIGDGDANAFLVELSSLLKELDCPYSSFVSGSITDRFSTAAQRLNLLIYLCSEVEAARMWYHKNPKEKPLTVELTESPTARDLKEALISLGFGKPPDNITAEILFTELEKKLRGIAGNVEPKNFIGQRIFNGSLTEKQWCQLEELKAEMEDEYTTRREMLLTRLEVTVQSFQWSDRLKDKGQDIKKIYDVRRSQLPIKPDVHISEILAADADLLIIEKTCAASVREHTRSSVNKVIIGSVPDRGGRPDEQKPPPPEIPSWQKNDSKGQSFSSSNFGSQQNASGGRPQSARGGSRGYQSNQDNRNASDLSGYQRSSRPPMSQQNYRGASGPGNYNNQQITSDVANSQYRSANYQRSEEFRHGQVHSQRSPKEHNPPCISPLNPSAPIFNPNPYPQAQIHYVAEASPYGFGGYAPTPGADFQQYGGPQFVEQNVPRYQGPNRGQYNRGNRRGGGQGRGGYNRY